MENLFSYGTLQYESVQLSTFGRKLDGAPDLLQGYAIGELHIQDSDVLNKSGEAVHPIIQFTGRAQDEVRGYVFSVSEEELHRADQYEVDDYKRVQVILSSGIKAWAYVSKEPNIDG